MGAWVHGYMAACTTMKMHKYQPNTKICLLETLLQRTLKGFNRSNHVRSAWMHGCICACIHGCMYTWLHGYMAAWMHGCMDAWYARLNECMRHPIPKEHQPLPRNHVPVGHVRDLIFAHLKHGSEMAWV